ncbi:hypothetical protein ACOMHN_039584 [Nucella lapillus]
MLSGHLVCANILMGSHVGIAVLANHAFSGKYLEFEEAWTSSVTCKMSGFLSLLSSTVSVLVIGFITVYHITALCFPNHLSPFNKCLLAAGCAVIWAVGFLLALVPFLPGRSHWGVQGQSGLCRLALFQDRRSRQHFTWFTVIVAVNCVWSAMTVAGQAVISRQTPQYRLALSSTQRSVFSSVRLMGKTTIANAVCWFAFGLCVIMGSGGVAVFDTIHDSMVVFVIPINSAVNPLLYWGTVYSQQQKQQQEEALIKLLKSRLRHDKKH